MRVHLRYRSKSAPSAVNGQSRSNRTVRRQQSDGAQESALDSGSQGGRQRQDNAAGGDNAMVLDK
jgi:hypothetical protein